MSILWMRQDLLPQDLELFYSCILLLGTVPLLLSADAEFVHTLVGENLTLVSSDRCWGAVKGSLVHLSSPGKSRDVAKLKKSQWSPSSGYEARFAVGDAVVFEEAAFNDNGLYELTCNTISKTVMIQVEVLIPYEVQATVGQSVKLPCYFSTIAQVLKSVRWEQDTDLVLEQWFESGETHCGHKFRGRVQMSQHALSRGDLSLTIQSVQLQDQGKFYCKVSERDNGEPAVVRLWVSKAIRNHSSSNRNKVSNI
ncbi:hypothetical protein WMY93_014649 [Mugilogobius chulae]|uniref:Ig-like domain-containing protein n=1 Tax=Mugilogobius chulae TaxID=88201 RepID=A0AAW0P754_9GOBI